MSLLPSSTPLSSRNIPLFIAFRVFFNARWYYPVMAVLFLDLGLSIQQYFLLNVAWAASIVCLEVPLGAVADQIGRRRVILLAAVLMIVEMCIFALAPRNSIWLFPLLLLNRVLSGAAEACASGADESLAYDSLREESRSAEWPQVLARLTRLQSGAFIFTMLLGAAIYDPSFVNRAFAMTGLALHASHETTLRWPVYLTLGNALLAFLTVLRMKEPHIHDQHAAARSAWAQTVASGRWLLGMPLVLFLLLAGLGVDSAVRLFLTVNSNYFRLIGLPEGYFGIIAAASALLGFLTAHIAPWLIRRFAMQTNIIIVSVIALCGLTGASLFLAFWGVFAIVPISFSMSLLGFLLSHYLNEYVVDSARRATVLSFKGLCFNLAYGIAGLLFAGYTWMRRDAVSPNAIFIESLRILPAYLACVVCIVAIAAARFHTPKPAPAVI